MWIKSSSEELINLDKISRFSTYTSLGKIHILANYDTAQFSTTIIVVDTKEEVKAVFDYILKAIQNDIKCIDSNVILTQIRSK